jgi:hypothetical protein
MYFEGPGWGVAGHGAETGFQGINEMGAMTKDTESAYVVLIIGYNVETKDIAFSDRWGSGTMIGV